MTSTEAVEVTAPKATVYIERKIQVRDYESMVVGLHYPVDLPQPISSDEPGFGEYVAACDRALKEGFWVVKAHIFDQLDLNYEDKNGVLVEKVASHFGGAAEIQSSPAAAQTAPAPAPQPAPVPPSQTGVPDPTFGTCAGCGGNQFWDNRDSKASGKYKATAPDGKCKDKGCAKGKWLNR